MKLTHYLLAALALSLIVAFGVVERSWGLALETTHRPGDILKVTMACDSFAAAEVYVHNISSDVPWLMPEGDGCAFTKQPFPVQLHRWVSGPSYDKWQKRPLSIWLVYGPAGRLAYTILDDSVGGHFPAKPI